MRPIGVCSGGQSFFRRDGANASEQHRPAQLPWMWTRASVFELLNIVLFVWVSECVWHCNEANACTALHIIIGKQRYQLCHRLIYNVHMYAYFILIKLLITNCSFFTFVKWQMCIKSLTVRYGWVNSIQYIINIYSLALLIASIREWLIVEMQCFEEIIIIIFICIFFASSSGKRFTAFC